MSDTPPRTVRTVLVSDPVWETLSLMAREMGADRDSLVNQALFTFARLNGYVTPGSVSVHASRPAASSISPAASASPAFAPAAPGDYLAGIRPPVRDDDTPAGLRAHPPGLASTDESQRVDGVEGFDAGWSADADLPHDDAQGDAFDRSGLDRSDAFDRAAMPDPDDDRSDLDGLNVAGDPNDVDHLLGESAPPPVAALRGPELVLYSERGEELERVRTDRFLIGRGKHCDLIIHSGKVSREHAAIVLEGDAFVIEDLGSSNGTWHDRKRITRRRVEDGDEYFICSEKITCRYA